MNQDERDRLNNLVAEVMVQRVVLVELCLLAYGPIDRDPLSDGARKLDQLSRRLSDITPSFASGSIEDVEKSNTFSRAVGNFLKDLHGDD